MIELEKNFKFMDEVTRLNLTQTYFSALLYLNKLNVIGHHKLSGLGVKANQLPDSSNARKVRS